MADKILVSTQEMEATINRYNDARETMDQARNAMDQALDHLNNCWKGPAWAAMMAKWAVMNGNIKNSDMAMARSIEGLRNTIATYDTSETDISGKAQALETGNKSETYV